ncbi:hypothetical protein BC941DRAFT_416826 [Chlamydoabsidia padenii]|nr:hypothetical protein BC941DRAFT_416826 [Chlamydoabsidia padenii]
MKRSFLEKAENIKRGIKPVSKFSFPFSLSLSYCKCFSHYQPSTRLTTTTRVLLYQVPEPNASSNDLFGDWVICHHYEKDPLHLLITPLPQPLLTLTLGLILLQTYLIPIQQQRYQQTTHLHMYLERLIKATLCFISNYLMETGWYVVEQRIEGLLRHMKWMDRWFRAWRLCIYGGNMWTFFVIYI